ncbi:Cys/Met metabolism PLP-dependent enzyme-domain-containing protein [Cyathus striatus]|nr:Cys/Met metabolism PLP-dependent enzyme-domain-containing protein [Cyathus striatus]
MSPALDLSAVNGLTNGASITNGVKKHRGKYDGDAFSTRAIHVGSEPDPTTGAQDAIGVHKGFEYSRSANPNRNALESALASLESGGGHALAFASGSATTATVLQSLGPNAHIISVNDVYGGTFRYMTRVAKENQGLETTFVDLEQAGEEQILAAVRENTKLVWVESPTNPTLRLINIARLSSLLHTLPNPPILLVDNTFLSPFYSSPILLGADIVLHSLTKYVNGHSDVVMGALILPTHHTALVEKLRFLQNAIGAVPSAFDSWLAQRGLKTLGVRMREHGRNALKIARVLEESPYVEEVIYPGLKSHPRHALAVKSLSPHAQKWIDSIPESEKEHGVPYGGMISVRLRRSSESAVRDSSDEAEKFLTSLRLFALAESLGGVESLAEHPAQMTHGSIPPAERQLLGIGGNLVRLSVGIEEVDDLVADVQQALEKAVVL